MYFIDDSGARSCATNSCISFFLKCCAKTNSMKTANIVCLRICCHIFISEKQSIKFIHFIYAYIRHVRSHVFYTIAVFQLAFFHADFFV